MLKNHFEVKAALLSYSLSGICVCCLNKGRKMLKRKNCIDCYKFLGGIAIPGALGIKICFECDTLLSKVCMFQQQIKRTYQILLIASQQRILNVDISAHAVQRMGKSELHTFECQTKISKETSEVQNEDNKLNIKIEEVHGNYIEIDKTVDSDHDITESVTLKSEDDSEEINIACSSDDIDDVKHINAEYIEEDGDRFISNENEELSVTDEDMDDKFSDDDIVMSKSTDPLYDHLYCRKNATEKSKKSVKLGGVSAMKIDRMYETYRSFNKEVVELLSTSKEEMIEIRKRDVDNPLFKKSPHRCVKCFMKFKTEALLMFHDDLKHSVLDSCTCEICGTHMSSSFTLDQHLDHHTHCLSCKICQYKTSLGEHMRAHLKEHPNVRTKPLKCLKCNVEFDTKEELQEHKIQCNDVEQKYQCDVCSLVFSKRKTIYTHMKIHFPSTNTEVAKELQCPHCSFKFAKHYRLKNHILMVHSGTTEPYHCEYCGKSIKYYGNLNKHLLTHKDKDQNYLYECKECDFTTRNREYHRKHMLYGEKHIHEAKFQCDHCGKKFSTKGGMGSHISQVHLYGIANARKQGSKPKRVKVSGIICPSVCNTCGKVCKNKLGLQKHLVSHTNEKTVPCGVCDKMFRHKYEMEQHMRRHIPKNPYEKKNFVCNICNKKFVLEYTLLRHVKYTHETLEKTVPCNLCDETFTTDYEVIAHFKQVHQYSQYE